MCTIKLYILTTCLPSLFVRMLKILILFLLLSFGGNHGESLSNEAELVFPQLFDARDELGTRVLKVNDKITLNLKKSSVVEDGFFLLTHEDGVPVRTYLDVDKLQEGLFHDEIHLASVFVTEEGGLAKVEGVVGPNLKIKPLEGKERSADGFYPHVLEIISKEKPIVGPVHGDYIHPRNTRLEERGVRRGVTKVYPEIRVVVDYQFREGFNHSWEMARYLMIEFNVVRLRYLTVANPKISLRFRVIEILSQEMECLYYKYIDDDNWPSVDGIATLYSLLDYVGNHSHTYAPYDVVYVVTGYDMVRVEGTDRQYSYQGFAFVGSVCTRHRVGFGEDIAHTYLGIGILAHELAHTLGCSHDENGEWSYLANYYADSRHCPWSDGYIMSYIRENANSMKFSPCCDKSMTDIALSDQISCLHTINTRTRLKKYHTGTLPGFYLSRDKQCKLSYRADKTTWYDKNNSTYSCKATCCVIWKGSVHCWPILLLDGTRCGRKMICINGDCVNKKRRYEIKTVGKSGK
ncbi:venom metalloproteinase antarease-like TtrivMP_A [Haemaphysalis longicornis]